MYFYPFVSMLIVSHSMVKTGKNKDFKFALKYFPYFIRSSFRFVNKLSPELKYLIMSGRI